eukprot:COSAG02_NODE_125_length_34972_cov_101.069997_13_plen_62_part_00
MFRCPGELVLGRGSCNGQCDRYFVLKFWVVENADVSGFPRQTCDNFTEISFVAQADAWISH